MAKWLRREAGPLPADLLGAGEALDAQRIAAGRERGAARVACTGAGRAGALFAERRSRVAEAHAVGAHLVDRALVAAAPAIQRAVQRVDAGRTTPDEARIARRRALAEGADLIAQAALVAHPAVGGVGLRVHAGAGARREALSARALAVRARLGVRARKPAAATRRRVERGVGAAAAALRGASALGADARGRQSAAGGGAVAAVRLVGGQVDAGAVARRRRRASCIGRVVARVLGARRVG